MKKEFALKNRTKSMKSYLTLPQRVTAWFLSAFMLLQILLPSAVLAANIIDASKITAAMQAPQFQPSTNNAFLYEKSSFENAADTSGYYNISRLHSDLLASKLNVGAPTLVPIAGDITIFIPTYPVGKLVGDSYVQARYIRQQIMEQLGRHLIDAVTDGSDESKQILRLYQNAKTFATTNIARLKFGDSLAATETITADMIWPERRTINGQNVLVPIVYLSDATIGKFAVNENKTEFLGGAAVFDTVTLDHSKLTLGPKTVLNTKSALVANDSIISAGGDVNLVTGGTMVLNGSTVDAAKNINIIAGNFAAKAQVIPYQDRYGSGTRLGRVTALNAAAGTISIQSTNDITFEGSTATAANGAITLNAGGNISILPVALSYQGGSNDGTWIEKNSSLDIVGSKLTAKDTISLAAQGAITISASELTSTQGGIELLAGQGIFVLDEQGNTMVDRKKYKGRTKGSILEFNTVAVRSVLSAGKNIIMESDYGDVTLRASNITSKDGTKVSARNGSVHLLITKEQNQYFENMVRKGTWTIKTKEIEKNVETGIPNAIVGGLAVEALDGVDVEYTGVVDADGNPDLDLNTQLNAIEKMPSMSWVADLRKDPTVALNLSKIDLKEVYKNKTTRQLSPAAMAIVAIAVACVTGGAGLSMFAGMGPVMTAAANTLITQAASSLLAGNSLSQTIDTMSSHESMKSLAISMVTAGAMQQVGGVFDAGIQSANPLVSYGSQMAQVVTDSVVQAGIAVVIDGGSRDDFRQQLKQSLATNAINSIGQRMVNKITSSKSMSEVSKYIAHAGMGCLTSGLSSKLNDQDFKDACPSGAAGAVIAQGTVDLLESLSVDAANTIQTAPDKIKPDNIGSMLSKLGAKGVDVSKFIAALTAFAVGGDVTAAATSAGMVAQSYRDSLHKVALTGSILQSMGMVGCESEDPISCGAKAAEAETKKSLVALNKYTGAEIQAELDAQRELGIFKSVAEYNSAYLSKEVLQQMADEADASSASTGGDVEEVLVEKRISILTSKIVEYTGKLHIRTEQAGEIVQDTVRATFDKPFFSPIKSALAFTAKKGVEIVNAAMDSVPGARDALDAKQKFEEGIGVGAQAYLYDGQFASAREFFDNSEFKDSLSNHSAKEISWIGSTVLGVALSAGVAYGVTKYIKPGKSRFADDALKSNRHRSSDDVNQELIDRGRATSDTPPFKAGTVVIQRDIEIGERFYMYMDKDQLAILSDPANSKGLGGWGTNVNFSSQSDALNQLAIDSKWKPKGIPVKVELSVTKPFKIFDGTAGPQGVLGGGAQQYFLDLPREGAKEFLKIVSTTTIP